MVNQEVGREDYAGFAQSIQTDSKMFQINTERASITLHRTTGLKCGRVGVFQTGNPAKVRECKTPGKSGNLIIKEIL